MEESQVALFHSLKSALIGGWLQVKILTVNNRVLK